MNSRRFKSRKSRTKAKKPKFLSLRLQLSPDETKTPEKSIEIPTSEAVTDACHQLDLFPPHPENLVEEKYTYTHDQDNVAYFFSTGDSGATTTLTGLLDASTITTSSSNNNSISITSLSPSAPLTYAYGGQNSELARTALRNREREPSEEKWVYYSEVVERKVKEEEVTSSAADLRCKDTADKTQRLSLKLDYEDILNAWSDKGPLYIHAETPQTVPDINDEFFGQETSHGLSRGYNGGSWTVPEMAGNMYSGGIGVKKEEEMKLGQREASVLRYKEKRQNRLFAKKIRYQVRKLNAEKRPRVKGRFVKRD
ncbi:zinc finger CONSTANS-LIKE 6 [Olea europaea subsp. europaea]|uniref:Zinc finger CONSTANS-LIKE 6 n=1 Tax=Olea europaea subsp. europaea TaxID=158383 RepID=A0A8S0SMF2_OLEEU|nr:zinc finger CONSTANS-LIKE 6 [Olea europaea subsp. europaea]